MPRTHVVPFQMNTVDTFPASKPADHEADHTVT